MPLPDQRSRSRCAVLGLIHVNKSNSSDPLTTIMASRAFAAVARAVLFVMVDPEDEQTRLLGQPRNNLGRADLPTLAFKIAGYRVASTAEGDAWTGKLAWTGETDRFDAHFQSAGADAQPQGPGGPGGPLPRLRRPGRGQGREHETRMGDGRSESARPYAGLDEDE